MKRFGPLKRSGFLKRNTRVNPVNKKRRAERHAIQFGVQAELCRGSECCVPTCQVVGCEPHHWPTIANQGKDKDTTPLCFLHHREFHAAGAKTFQERYGVDLLRIAKRLSARCA